MSTFQLWLMSIISLVVVCVGCLPHFFFNRTQKEKQETPPFDRIEETKQDVDAQ